MKKREIYTLLGNDKVVVDNLYLNVLTNRGIEDINGWLTNYQGDERLTVIPVEPIMEWKPYLRDYTIDWSRIDERIRSIID